MKIRIFVKNDTLEMRQVEELIQRIKDSSDIEIETLDTDEREGKEVAEVYDIYDTPSFLVVTDDGVMVDSWIGKIPAEYELKAAIN